ncbi:uncharacterized protein B0I36DRAFT_116075 [Microdochium trichocladiopsis]|uniref:Uncharacterized protein n=1 Tax=Microdochium trichocladiopsis TaxID=1682393 RepID=A0A9P8Y613_9PEZI|nr:uncharacterized protein B0I36DRAFT_116075 [Microdochium trichocladiopsis]KAH7030924.1 hypothetical protein B0I36DRAFT_116075 [Microdochium trichocladiopsis]
MSQPSAWPRLASGDRGARDCQAWLHGDQDLIMPPPTAGAHRFSGFVPDSDPKHDLRGEGLRRETNVSDWRRRKTRP